jgi:hypothetical protein
MLHTISMLASGIDVSLLCVAHCRERERPRGLFVVPLISRSFRFGRAWRDALEFPQEDFPEAFISILKARTFYPLVSLLIIVVDHQCRTSGIEEHATQFIGSFINLAIEFPQGTNLLQRQVRIQ